MKEGNIIPKLPASSGAVIIYRGKVLMIKRDNKPDITNPDKWAIPGGKVEKGETFERTLRRELKEEINVVPQNYTFMGIFNFIKDKVRRAIYFAELSEKEYEKIKLGDEGQALGWFLPEEIKKIGVIKEIKDFFSRYEKEIKEALVKGTKLKKLIKILKNEGVIQ